MDTRTKEGEQVRSGYEANCNQGSILKNEATIVLPRHDGKMKKNTFHPSSWCSSLYYTQLDSVSCH